MNTIAERGAISHDVVLGRIKKVFRVVELYCGEEKAELTPNAICQGI